MKNIKMPYFQRPYGQGWSDVYEGGKSKASSFFMDFIANEEQNSFHLDYIIAYTQQPQSSGSSNEFNYAENKENDIYLTDGQHRIVTTFS